MSDRVKGFTAPQQEQDKEQRRVIALKYGVEESLLEGAPFSPHGTWPKKGSCLLVRFSLPEKKWIVVLRSTLADSRPFNVTFEDLWFDEFEDAIKAMIGIGLTKPENKEE